MADRVFSNSYAISIYRKHKANVVVVDEMINRRFVVFEESGKRRKNVAIRRGLTDEIAWESGRRVEIRVPCSSVCLGDLNKCKSSAVISRRSFTAGHGRPNLPMLCIIRFYV